MSELASSENSPLLEALDDEHQAWATYDQVIADFGEVLTVFQRLQEASQQRHLPAFPRCAKRGGESDGCGHRRRHRGGRT